MTKKEKSKSAFTIHEWANIHSIASSDFRSCNLQGIRDELKAKESRTESKKHLDYQSLFAETEATCPIDHDSSILSPAAYFADLMRMIKTTSNSVPSGLSLEERRPDLKDIVLDAKNTTTEVPYLEIVNDVLKKKLTADTGKDALQQLATAKYPFNLPYNPPLEKIRTYLKHFKTDLATIYELFKGKSTAIARETLGLSVEEYNLITVADSSYEGLSKAYALAIRDVNELVVIPDLQNTDKIPNEATSLVILATVENKIYLRVFDADGRKIIDHGEDYLSAKYSDFEKFKKLVVSKGFGRRYTNDDGSVSNNEEEQEEILSSVWRLTGHDKGTVDDLHRLETLFAQTGMTQEQLKELVYQGLALEEGRELTFNEHIEARNLFINRCISKQIGAFDSEKKSWRFYLQMSTTMLELYDDRGNEHGRWYGRSAHLLRNIAWDTLHRFVRLANKLQWSFADLDWALVSVDADTLDEKAIINLAKIKKLKDRFNLSIDELTCFWHDMKATGQGDGEIPQDFFSRTFNTPIPFFNVHSRPDQEGDHWDGILRILGNDTVDESPTWIVDDRETANNASIRAQLCGALGVGDVDLDAMVSQLLAGLSEANRNKVELTLNFVTRLYGISKLANVLGLRVSETLLLLKILNKNEIEKVDDLIEVTEFFDWLKAAGLSVDELQYMTSGISSRYVETGYAKEGVKPMLAELSHAAKGWRISDADFKSDCFDEMDAEFLFSAMANAGYWDKNGNICALPEDFRESLLDESSNFMDPKSIFYAGDKIQNLSSALKAIGAASADDTNDLSLSYKFNIPLVKIAEKTDLSFLFPEDSDQQLKIAQVRDALIRMQRLSPLLLIDSFVGNGIDDTTSLEILHVLQSSEIIEFVDEGWIVVQDFADIGKIDDKAFKDLHLTLNQSQIQTVKNILLSTSSTVIFNAIKLRHRLQVSGVVEKLAGFFGAKPTVMRELLALTAQATGTADYIQLLLTPIKPDSVAKFVETLARYFFIARKMGLDAQEINNLAHILGRTLNAKFEFSSGDIRNIHIFKQLASAFRDSDSGFLKHLSAKKSVTNLAAFTDGKDRQTILLGVAGLDEIETLGGVGKVAELKRIFDLAIFMGVDVTFLKKLSRLCDTSVDTNDSEIIDGNWQAHLHLAEELLKVVKSKYDSTQWASVYEPIAAVLNERERDALVGLLRHQLSHNKTVAKHFDEMITLQDLSNYLLIDVEMSGVAKVSRVKQGINTLQRYIQRCHTGLEGEGAVTFPLGDKEWAWRSHYRLWEANRKVFLYPENYLDPGLRKIKTPLYQELEDELLQGEITDEAVTKAYINYFDKLDELASLKIVDACAATVTHPGATSDEETLFIIGKTKNDPPTYYYRSAVLDKNRQISQWRPWQKINLSIHVDSVSCLYANHRLHLFWVEQKQSNERAEITGKKTTTTKASVKFSYHNVSGNWVPPQILPGLEEVAIDEVIAESKAESKPDGKAEIKAEIEAEIEAQTNKFKFFDVRSPFPPDRPVAHLILSRLTVEKGQKAMVSSFRSIDASEAKTLANKLLPDTNIVSAFHLANEHFAAYGSRLDIIIEVDSDSTQTILGMAKGQVDNAFTRQYGIPSHAEDKHFYRLGSYAASELRGTLITGGVKELLSLASQRTAELPSLTSMGLTKPCPSELLDFELSSAYAIYYREIFFHIPFLIADTLNHNQHFEDAQTWYHHIFNPMAAPDAGREPNGASYWCYRPFRGHKLEKLEEFAENPQELKIYEDDPFDPHAIAALRLGAYEKAIVMKYIDNLLDWGDQLFAQDSWESIVQAMMLYVMAQDLLGKKPKQTLPTHSPKPINLSDLLDKKIALAEPFHVEDTKYFPVAPNTNFAGYWDRAEDRLFKIRHCMNIKGIVRQLALFQPPIDPRQLIRAMAAGGDITSVASQLAAPVPHYRFSTMIQQAKSVTSTLTQLGSALLSALEKKDAEQLNLLRSTHEKAILKLTTRLKEKQIEDASKNLDSLTASLEGAERRQTYYANLSAQKLITEETSSMNLTIAALSFHTVTPALQALTVPGWIAPSIFGLADGGSKWGNAINVAAQFSESTANVLNQGSQLAATKAQNERRKEDWQLQENLAGHDIEQIKAQIEGATIMQEIAQMDLDMHQKSIEQADEREDLLRGKFTNRELYQWMSGRVSSVYFQTYKIAFDLAQAAEKSYQYERNTDDTLITFGYWDSLKKGLLAGEGLMLGLNQLEKAYMDDNERPLEIEKTISLNQLDLFNGDKENTTLNALKNDGKCLFHLTERLFDEDFPGHYCRKIKSIAITVPAVVGPYQNVQATLKQKVNRVLLKPDPQGVASLLKIKSNSSGLPDSIRSDWRRQQNIAVSKGVNDSGMFELNFHDERYLPFEGTGAVSDWEFEMRKKANKSILESVSDVIIHLRYTAEDGGDAFREQVIGLQR